MHLPSEVRDGDFSPDWKAGLAALLLESDIRDSVCLIVHDSAAALLSEKMNLIRLVPRSGPFPLGKI